MMQSKGGRTKRIYVMKTLKDLITFINAMINQRSDNEACYLPPLTDVNLKILEK